MLHVKGPLLTVDVGDRSVETTDIGEILAAFIGGRGVNVRLAHERTLAGGDTLSITPQIAGGYS